MKNPYLPVALYFFTLGWSFPAAAQAPVHVQTNFKQNTGASSSINLNFGSSSTAGHLIVVHLTWDKQSRTINTVSDAKGNTYHQIGSETNWGSTYRSAFYYAYNISAGASPLSISATLSGSVNSLFEIYISEYSNVLSTSDPLDQSRVTGSSGTTVSSGAVTTTATNELIYGVAVGETVTLAGGSGYTVRSTANQNIVEDKSGATAGSYSASFTGGGNWIAAVATFKPLVTLPISLASFDATVLKDNKVLLNWATATESNSAHFDVEHSYNGQEWTTAGQVNAAGNSVTGLQYSFVDENPSSGVGYYRLKEVDRDGNATISKTVTVHLDAALVANIRIYPNPATNYLTVEGASQTIAIFNTVGQRMAVRASAQADSKTILDVSSLSKGAYFVKVGDKSTLFLRQ